MSISFTIMYLFFWFSYVWNILDTYSLFNFSKLPNEFYAIWEFFLLWISLGIIIQSLLMILVYLPSKQQFYGKDHRNEIVETSRKFLRRFDNKLLSIPEFVFLFTITSLWVIWHFYFWKVNIELFVGIMLVFSPLALSYIYQYYQKI